MNNLVQLRREDALGLIDAFEKMTIELEAQRQALKLATELSPQYAVTLADALVAARQNSALVETTRQKYKEIREMFHAEQIDALAQKTIAELIARLRPTDQLN